MGLIGKICLSQVRDHAPDIQTIQDVDDNKEQIIMRKYEIIDDNFRLLAIYLF